ncbi:MAG: membrane protein insertase YidC [Xanthomonadales bacterium]|nr:membrane protein insertase YidC [Xanthomonadales bacterium]
MNQTRTMLVLALCFVAFLLWQQWDHDYASTPVVPTANSASAVASSSGLPMQAPGAVPVPMATAASTTATPVSASKPVIPAAAAISSLPLVKIDTDVLHIAINPAGASMVRADLVKYPKKLDSPESVRLLSNAAEDYYVAESGLVSAHAPAPDHTAIFSSAKTSYQMAPGQDTLAVDFSWTDASGLKVVKRYTFTRGSYVIGVQQRIDNGSASTWTGNAYRQFERVEPPEPKDENFAAKWANPARYSFAGAAWFSDGKYDTLKYADFKEEPLNVTDKGGWMAMQQAFFLGAWIPEAGKSNQYTTALLPGKSADKPIYLVRAAGAAISVAPGASQTITSKLYLGPKLPKVLGKVAPGLNLAVNYGMLTVIAKPLHGILSFFHSWVGNWGIAIILLVLLIKAVFFKLSEMQYRSMAKMKKLAPKIKSLKERFPDDKAKQQQEMMALYKKEKANPAGGCLPMLVQIPVFFGLYYMLPQSVELRQAPFFGWIQDLLAPDPLFVLPAIYAVILIATQFLSPTTGMDPTTAKMMKFMPVLFAVMFAFFPAGLVLYYVVNGALSLAQQWVITRRIEAEPSHS